MVKWGKLFTHKATSPAPAAAPAPNPSVAVQSAKGRLDEVRPGACECRAAPTRARPTRYSTRGTAQQRRSPPAPASWARQAPCSQQPRRANPARLPTPRPQAEELLTKKRDLLERQAAEQLQAARQHNAQGNKAAALQALKRKKLLEAQLEQSEQAAWGAGRAGACEAQGKVPCDGAGEGSGPAALGSFPAEPPLLLAPAERLS